MRFSLGPRFSMKKDITPGPGAYSPQDIKNKTGHAFSKAARFPPPVHADTPGPGAYNPVVAGTFDSIAKRSLHIAPREAAVSDDGWADRQTPSRTSSDDSAVGAAYRRDADLYMMLHGEKRQVATDRGAAGTVAAARTEMFRLLQDHPIMIIGEGSHEDNHTAEMLFDLANIPLLQDAGVSTVYVEHLYETHLESIRSGDLVAAEGHLNAHTYLRVDGTPSPAADFCRFVEACGTAGIHVVSIEDPAIYRHYPDLRIPNLNNRAVDIITTLTPPAGKALVYIGAAHTNSHNDLGRTPGLAEVLEGAVEMVVVGGDFELPIHSVGEGCVFRVG